MHFSIKTLTKLNPFEADPSDTIETLKLKVQEQMNIPISQQRLIYAGRSLDDVRTLLDYNICEDAVVHLVLRLPPGQRG